ncbi:MAG: hypothetical protein AABO57_13860 [Acidobacteriota bacterium]
MDGVILLAIIAAVILIWFYDSRKKGIERNKLRKTFAYLYQMKDSSLYSAALHEHFEEVVKAIPWLDRAELERMRDDSLKKTAALAGAAYLHFESQHKFIRTNPFANVALQKEDRNLVDAVFVSVYGQGAELLNSEPEDEVLSLIRNVLIQKKAQRTDVGT